MNKRTLLAAAAWLFCLPIFSQTWEFGLGLGAANYQGDLVQPLLFTLKETNASGGVFLRRNFKNDRWALRLGATAGRISGSDLNYRDRLGRGFDFRASVAEFAATAERNFFGQYRKDGTARRAEPYVFAGLGYALTDPKTDFNEAQTSGDPDQINQDKRDLKKNALVFPVGAGYKFRLKRGTLGVEMGFRPTTSDYLDGVSVAGNPDLDDWYLFGGVNYAFRIGKPPVDSDGDGVSDKNDKCPKEKGSHRFLGCPDTDGDGFQDTEDDCPTTAGLATFKGCPDSDGDGLKDSDDACPTVKGDAAMRGCPDSDGDGLGDGDDVCPTEKGDAATKGCPDADFDGIADLEDQCPREKGPKELRGCPDLDGDGIADKDDDCPREKGVRSKKGCPEAIDGDGDGVADADDLCPSQKGAARHRGCPDSDGDDVADNLDKCPEKAGTASNSGCPEMKTEEKQRLEFAMRAVQFETASSKLLKTSTSILDEIAAIMVNYPEAKLRIEGHTDSQGDAASNQRLSESRAKTCLDYLASKGVDRARMVSAGLGETRPVADNATKAGRDLNRRVEFSTFY